MLTSSSVTIGLMVLAWATICMSQTKDYCNPKLCGKKINTLCKSTPTTWGSACAATFPNASIITADDIKAIVDAHNELRRKIAKGLEVRGASGPQPSASNMRQLVWDDELAAMAQAHVQQCVFKHDDCRNVDRFSVGQNAHAGLANHPSVAKFNMASVVHSWFGEVNNMKSDCVNSIKCSATKEIKHYTQVVWAKTAYVGCGLASYKATNKTSWEYERFTACNYGPGGNLAGTPVYLQGPAGSACPEGTQNNDGLCI